MALRLYDQHIKGSPFKLTVSRVLEAEVEVGGGKFYPLVHTWTTTECGCFNKETYAPQNEQYLLNHLWIIPSCSIQNHIPLKGVDHPVNVASIHSLRRVSRCHPPPPQQPIQQPMLLRPRAPLRGQREEGNPLGRRRRAPREPAAPWAPHDAKPRTPLRMTSSSGSVRFIFNRIVQIKQRVCVLGLCQTGTCSSSLSSNTSLSFPALFRYEGEE